MVQRGNWSSVTAGGKFDHAGSVYGSGATATTIRLSHIGTRRMGYPLSDGDAPTRKTNLYARFAIANGQLELSRIVAAVLGRVRSLVEAR